eukprot:6397108-Amphidinium_carterae.1
MSGVTAASSVFRMRSRWTRQWRTNKIIKLLTSIRKTKQLFKGLTNVDRSHASLLFCFSSGFSEPCNLST